MLICNNCGHSNPDHNQQCDHCNMSGDFTPHEIQRDHRETEEDHLEDLVQCINCGEHISVDETKCGTCYFPLKRENQTMGFPHKHSLKLLRRTA